MSKLEIVEDHISYLSWHILTLIFDSLTIFCFFYLVPFFQQFILYKFIVFYGIKNDQQSRLTKILQ